MSSMRIWRHALKQSKDAKSIETFSTSRRILGCDSTTSPIRNWSSWISTWPAEDQGPGPSQQPWRTAQNGNWPLKPHLVVTIHSRDKNEITMNQVQVGWREASASFVVS